MKKVVFCLLICSIIMFCGLKVGCADEILSNEALQKATHMIVTEYSEYEVESSLFVSGTEHLIYLLRNDDERRLVVLNVSLSACDILFDTRDAIPQTELPAYITCRPKGLEYGFMVSEKNTITHISDGNNFLVVVFDGETYEETAFFQWKDNTYHLVEYSKRVQRFVNIENDVMYFSNLGSGYDGMAKYRIDAGIRNLNFDLLPYGIEQLPQTQQGIPVIVCVENGFPKASLGLQNASFASNKRYDVYMGPGKSYGRSGNGKAVVSTNDWIQVFGKYSGWLLIQYGIKEGQYRFGWIQDEALPKDEKVKELEFSCGERILIGREDSRFCLTDDPLGTKNSILEIKGVTEVDVLARLGINWVYIRLNYEGKIYYGFISNELIIGNG